jgi:hypothetical protein
MAGTIEAKEKAAEIAADFKTTFYHVQVGATGNAGIRTTPVPFWLICFSDAIKGPIHQMFFGVTPHEKERRTSNFCFIIVSLINTPDLVARLQTSCD